MTQPPSLETAKHVGDAVSIAVVLGALAQWLPPIAALLTIIWTGIRIYESKTVQDILRQFRNP
jgi:peptidoglycan biosynthesis protein MviN/MurJ (putative lipid II flippase)